MVRAGGLAYFVDNPNGSSDNDRSECRREGEAGRCPKMECSSSAGAGMGGEGTVKHEAQGARGDSDSINARQCLGAVAAVSPLLQQGPCRTAAGPAGREKTARRNLFVLVADVLDVEVGVVEVR